MLPHPPSLRCQQACEFVQAPEVLVLIKLGVSLLVIHLALTVLWLVLQSQILFGCRAFPYRYVCISPVLSFFSSAWGGSLHPHLRCFPSFGIHFPYCLPLVSVLQHIRGQTAYPVCIEGSQFLACPNKWLIGSVQRAGPSLRCADSRVGSDVSWLFTTSRNIYLLLSQFKPCHGGSLVQNQTS